MLIFFSFSCLFPFLGMSKNIYWCCPNVHKSRFPPITFYFIKYIIFTQFHLSLWFHCRRFTTLANNRIFLAVKVCWQLNHSINVLHFKLQYSFINVDQLKCLDPNHFLDRFYFFFCLYLSFLKIRIFINAPVFFSPSIQPEEYGQEAMEGHGEGMLEPEGETYDETQQVISQQDTSPYVSYCSLKDQVSQCFHITRIPRWMFFLLVL